MTGVPQLLMWLAATGVLTIAGLTAGVAQENGLLAAASTAMFSLVAIAAAAAVNASRHTLSPGLDAADAARRNALLFAIVYGWGGLAMLSAYYLTALKWQHAWQYGAGMLVIALGLCFYRAALGRPANALRSPGWLSVVQSLTLIQGIAAVVGLVFVFASGKLLAGKSDWAANLVFLAGGGAIAALSLIAVRTQQRLKRRTS